MARIKVKLRELRDGNMRFISLVDRAATRIPFRILKRDKENEMGIDLTKVVKGDKSKAEVTAVVVFAQKDEQLGESVRQSIAEAGFDIATVKKADEETLVFAQSDPGDDEIVLVRLSDQMVVAVKDLEFPVEGTFADEAKASGFYRGMVGAVSLLAETLDKVMKTDDREKAKVVIADFNVYALALLEGMPASCFKADAAVCELIAKAAAKLVEEKLVLCQKCNKEHLPSVKCEEVKKEEPVVEIPKEEPKKEETPVELVKEVPPVVELPKIDEIKEEEIPKQEPVKEEVQKVDLGPVMEALKVIQDTQKTQGDQILTLSQKVDGVVTEQETTKKRLDETVKKADDLQGKLATTVNAVPKPEDKPAGEKVEKKEDFEPIRDTAFQRRRQRI